MIAIACLALIVGIIAWFLTPQYASQKNEFENFVGIYNAFEK